MDPNKYREYGDRADYTTLYKYAIQAITGPSKRQVVEIGTRKGGSAMLLQEIIKGENPNRFMHTVDPYGGKPYLNRNEVVSNFYNDDLYLQTMKDLSAREQQWTHWKMRSLDWIAMYPNIEFWAGGEQLKDEFCFVYLDGDHVNETVKAELDFFIPRTKGYILVDNADKVDPETFGIKYTLEDDTVVVKC